MCGLGGLGTLSGCALDDDARADERTGEPAVGEPAVGEPAVGELAQAVTAVDWTAVVSQGNGIRNAQVATIGGRTIMVDTGGVSGATLRWRERTGTNTWSAPTTIFGQDSYHKPSLAAFNGYLYMLRADPISPVQQWLSRFDPATNTWTSSTLLAHWSFGGPAALVGYGNFLYLIGVDPSSKQLWRATMSIAESVSATTLIPGHASYSRVSAAVHKCKLYFTHRNGGTVNLVHGWFNGSTWSSAMPITGKIGGGQIQGVEAPIAERAGLLHLLHREAGGATNAPLFWSYHDGTTWGTEEPIGTTWDTVSLTHGGLGVVTAFAPSSASYPLDTRELNHPLPPFTPPCGFGLAGAGAGAEAEVAEPTN